MSDITTFSECVIGYRSWAVDPFLRLWSLTAYARTPWVPGINEAVCGRENVPHLLGGGLWVDHQTEIAPKGHDAPHQHCGCGLYCHRSIGEVLDGIEWPEFDEIRGPVLPGAVAVWGNLQVHHGGFRASHACVVALATMPDMPAEVIDLAGHVAERYRVPLVPPHEIESEASKSGTPLPKSVGPELSLDPFPGYYGLPVPLPSGSFHSSNSAGISFRIRSTALPTSRARRGLTWRETLAYVLVVLTVSYLAGVAAHALIGNPWIAYPIQIVFCAALGWFAGDHAARRAGRPLSESEDV